MNDVKVTNHHGLLTTNRLSAIKESICHLIAQRVWESVFDSCIKKQTKVALDIYDCEFSFKFT